MGIVVGIVIALAGGTLLAGVEAVIKSRKANSGEGNSV